MTKNLKSLKKTLKISLKLRVFSDRLFERSHRGGCIGGLMGMEGGWATVGWRRATARWGTGGNSGVPKNSLS